MRIHWVFLATAIALLSLGGCGPVDEAENQADLITSFSLAVEPVASEVYDNNYLLAPRSTDIDLYLLPIYPEEQTPSFLGWELSANGVLQASIIDNYDPDFEFGQIFFPEPYRGIATLARYHEGIFERKLIRVTSALTWEPLVSFTGNHALSSLPMGDSNTTSVFCEGDIAGSRCQLYRIDDASITTLSLPGLTMAGSPYKFHTDGRAAVYDFDNELIYYRAAHEDPWTNIALPAAFTASSPWYVVCFEFQLVSDGFWALLNVNHEEYGDEHRSRYCRYVAGVGWNECLEVENRRMDAAVALADDSLYIFGVKSTRVGYEDYYHTFIHWPVDDSGVGAATEVAFPRDLTPNEYGYVQTEPMMFADTGGDEGYVLVNYTSKYVQGTAPTTGKMLYHLNDGVLEYVTEVQDLLDGQMVFRIYPIGRDRYLSSRQYN